MNQPAFDTHMIRAADLLESLKQHCVPGKAAYRLGQWLLEHGPVTTGQIADLGRAILCSSVFERLRCDLVKRCGWPINTRPIPGRKTCWYWIEGVHQEPKEGNQ